MKSLQLSLESAQVVRSSLSESDLRFSIGQTLHSISDCVANFAPTSATVPSDPEQADSIGLYGANREYGLGEVVRLAKTLDNADNTDDTPVLKKGVAFKGDLNIVKMALKGSSDTGNANNPKMNKVTRTFVVYYKKEAMGSYSTLGGEPCTESDLSGCYFNQCQVQYQLDDDDTTSTNFDKVCSVSDCANYGSGGRGANCYQADESGEERTLVGCGGTNKAKGTNTTAFGYGAGKFNTGAYNTFIGFKAGHKNTTAYGNTFIGKRAGLSNKTGVQNTAIGMDAGNKNTGPNNTFIGYGAGLKNISGHSNTFIGSVAGQENLTAHGNTFIGMNAGNKTTDVTKTDGTIKSGHSNTFIGTNAGYGNKTGENNTAIGHTAGFNLTDVTKTDGTIQSGHSNTFIGTNAGDNTTTGANNTAIGHSAGSALTTGIQNTLIGQGAKAPSATGSQQLNIGNLIVGRGPASAPTFDSTATTTTGMPQGEVRILGGPLKVCDNTGGACNAVTTGSHTHTAEFQRLDNARSQVRQNLQSSINANTRNLQSSINANTRTLQRNINRVSSTTSNNINIVSNALGAHKSDTSAHGLSSRVFKKNIVPYDDLDKSLQHIVETPLFTYQYKEDLPNKTRMGIIAEELPSFLQLRRSFVTPSGVGAVLSHNHKGKPHIHAVEGKKHSSDDSQKVKSKTKIRLKSKVAPSQPDWVSIYGTLWAGIKALFQKFKAFQENTIQEISHIKKQLKALDSKAQKQALELTKQASQMLKEIMDLKAQFKETKKQVEKSQKELSTKAKEQSQTITQLQKEQDSKIQAQAHIIAKQAQAIEQQNHIIAKQAQAIEQLEKRLSQLENPQQKK